MDPLAGLIFHNGSLYGTTYGLYGTGGGCGAVYEISPPATGSAAWAATAIHSFAGSDGCGPGAPVSRGPGGVLYGTTFFGGSGTGCPAPVAGCGVVFQLSPPSSPGGSWAYAVVYNFSGQNGDGAFPWRSGLVVGNHGVLYGTTQCGGSGPTANDCSGSTVGSGTVFSLTPPATPGGAWTETILHSFTGGADGAVPVAGLALGPDGVLYGTTSAGGSTGNGTVFSIRP
jgi:uncharacterized repeat protein (TIGR03803 family)